MKKLLSFILFAIMGFSLTACGNSVDKDNQSNSSKSASENNVADITSVDKSKILVAYFSRADENYGVGYIKKGNTCIIAEMIADEVRANLFEIERITPYPEKYDDCTDEAKKEQNDKARPKLTKTVENFENYDIIFLGYPNWWGDMPMPVYTFLESYDFSGKTIIPFCTHGGSGLSETPDSIKKECSGATVLDGLAIKGTTAQKNQEDAMKDVVDWLDKLGFKD